MLNSTEIRKIILTLAVCTAAGSAAGAVISADAQTLSQTSETENAAAVSAPEITASTETTSAPAPTVAAPEEIEGTVNILLIGTDERCTDYDDRGRGDVTLLCSVNARNKSLRLVSFERSTGVSWSGHGDIMLTSTYAYGGPELTADCISSSFDLELDGYAHVDFVGFSKIIDAMGGIDIYLTAQEAEALNQEICSENCFTEGDSHLDGSAALAYCRLRRIDDNWHRVQRQRNAIQAVVNKGKSLRAAGIKKLAEAAIPLVDTNISKGQLASLVFSAPKFAGMEAEQMTVPDRDRIWTYNGIEGAVTGFDREYESGRIKQFLYR